MINAGYECSAKKNPPKPTYNTRVMFLFCNVATFFPHESPTKVCCCLREFLKVHSDVKFSIGSLKTVNKKEY